MDIISLIDGTGRWHNDDYERDMQDSFCSQIFRIFQGKKKLIRGPSDEGFFFNDKAEEAVRHIVDSSGKGTQRVFLAGYSRGAAIALEAAERLNRRKEPITVDGLFLFDPVVRIPSRGETNVSSVPTNVRLSRTASRDLKDPIVAKYEGKLLNAPYNLLPLATHGQAKVLEKLPLLKKVPWRGNPIRPEFGTFIVTPCGIGDHQSKKFVGSHGAMGGVGWSDVEEDGDCQVAVAAWMSHALASIRLNITLRSFAPTSSFKT